MADGEKSLQSKLLKDMSLEELNETMDKVAIHLDALLPVDAEYVLHVINPYNFATSFITSYTDQDKFNAPAYLRKAAATLEKENK